MICVTHIIIFKSKYYNVRHGHIFMTQYNFRCFIHGFAAECTHYGRALVTTSWSLFIIVNIKIMVFWDLMHVLGKTVHWKEENGMIYRRQNSDWSNKQIPDERTLLHFFYSSHWCAYHTRSSDYSLP